MNRDTILDRLGDKPRDTESSDLKSNLHFHTANEEVNLNSATADQEGAVIRGDVEKPVRTIGTLGILSAAFNILSSWFGVGSTFLIGIPHGGPVVLIYGLIVISLVYAITALSLAEFSARYPTAGGQYHWTSLLAPKRYSRSLSYACGASNTIGRIGICASVTLIVAQLTLGIAAFNSDVYTIERWHVFVLYQGVNVISLALNGFLLRRAPWVQQVGFSLSIVSLFVITITCLAVANPKRSSEYVWATFINETGWENNAIVFLTGLVNPNFGFGGLDGAVHLSEDCFNPTKTVPLAIIYSIIIGLATAFMFTVVMLYCISDLSLILTTRTSIPLFEMWAQATRSVPATNVFMILFTGVAVFTLIGSVLTASRLTWAFARDNALILSKYLKKIDSNQGIPLLALVFNAFWIALLGCVYIGSSTAFNTLVGTGLLVEQISFAFPAGLLLWRRRAPGYLPKKGHFNMGRLGWAINGTVVAWTVLILPIYSFPLVKPVTAGNMNYTSAVLGGMLLLVILNWTAHANRHYQGPQIVLVST